MRDRPIGVWLITILAGIQFVLAIAHFLQACRGSSRTCRVGTTMAPPCDQYAIVWALLIWVWGWVTWSLYTLNPQGWLVVLLAVASPRSSASSTWRLRRQATPDLTLTFIVDVVIFAYAMLPSTQKAFGLKDKLPP